MGAGSFVFKKGDNSPLVVAGGGGGGTTGTVAWNNDTRSSAGANASLDNNGTHGVNLFSGGGENGEGGSGGTSNTGAGGGWFTAGGGLGGSNIYLGAAVGGNSGNADGGFGGGGATFQNTNSGGGGGGGYSGGGGGKYIVNSRVSSYSTNNGGGGGGLYLEGMNGFKVITQHVGNGAVRIVQLSEQFTGGKLEDLNSTTTLTIIENQPINTVVGEFNATASGGGQITYHLVAGENNNSLFTLDENGTLKTAVMFDFESNASNYTVQVEARDSLGASVQGIFTVSLLDVFEIMNVGINDGLVLYYPFEETDGTVVQDNSVNLLNANLIDGNLNATGYFGSGLELNNEEQAKIDLGANALALPTNWTITSWFTTPFNVDTVLAVHALASGSNDAHVAFDSWGEQNLGVFDNTFKFVDFGATDLAAGWHHLVARGEGGTTSFWIDGTSVGSVNANVASPVEVIGNLPGGFGRFADKIDDFRIYNRSLSVTEIDILYGGGNGDFFPFDIELSTQVVLEGSPVGTFAGQLVSDSAIHGPYQFALISGKGDSHNTFFRLDGNGTLSTNATIDYEETPSLSFRINAIDKDNRNLEKFFTIQITDVLENSPPRDLNSLEPLSFFKNQPIGTVVGEFNATSSGGSQITYHLAAGENNNPLFTLDENGTLRTAVIFDYSLVGQVEIRVRVTAQNGLSTEKTFMVEIKDVLAPIVETGEFEKLNNGGVKLKGIVLDNENGAKVLERGFYVSRRNIVNFDRDDVFLLREDGAISIQLI